MTTPLFEDSLADDSFRQHVLYIEDDPVSVALIEAVIGTRYPRLTLSIAESVKAGVAMARAATPPDLILLDMRLPDGSGIEVIRELNPELSRHQLKVVLLTADMLSPDVVKAMSLGAVDCLSKPLDLQVFYRKFSQLLRGEERDPMRPPYREPSSAGPGGFKRPR